MPICLIQVPYMIGDDRHPASHGTGSLVQACTGDLRAAGQLVPAAERVERDTPFRDSGSASLAVNIHLARIVHQTVATGNFPLVSPVLAMPASV